MENKYHITGEVDLVAWESFCQRYGGNVFQSPYFFQICQAAKYYHPHPLFAWKDGEFCATIMPVEVKILPSAFNLVANRFVIYGGALWKPGHHKAITLLFKHFLHQKSLPAYLFLEVRNFAPADEIRDGLETIGLQYLDYLNYTIDLTLPLETIFSRFKPDRRRNIRKAEKTGLEWRLAENLQDVEIAYQILKQLYQDKGVPLADISLFTAAFEELNQRGIYQILLTEYEGQVIGAKVLFIYNGIGYEWYSASLKRYLHLRANEWFVWKTLHYLKDRGCHTFDFCGAGRPDEKYGVRDFKKRFGGQEHNFGRFLYIPRPKLYGMVNRLYALKKKS